MISRRDFLQMLALAAGASALGETISSAAAAADELYDPPAFGNLSLIHIGDCHGQLLPHYFRETASRMGVGGNRNSPTNLVGEFLLEHYRVMPGTLRAHALTHLNFENAALVYGRVGGIAHLATLIKRLRASRPEALLLDSGDAWQGSGLSQWTRGAEMVEMSSLLGVDAMTGDWEFALGGDRLREILASNAAKNLSFLAQNVRDRESAKPPFKASTIYFVNGFPIGVIGQAYPHIGRFGGRDFVPEWKFGIDEERLQRTVEGVRAHGARFVVLLSHAGLAADIKLAGRVSGIDVILSGHTHDAFPAPVVIGKGKQTLIASSGSNGKFVGLLDVDIQAGRMRDYRFRLIPVFSNLIAPDVEVASAVKRWRTPYAARLDEPLAVSEGMLYRRDGFMGSFDQLILDILLRTSQAEIAIGPGYRWGETLLPGDEITLEHVLNHTVAAKSGYFIEALSGGEILERLEAWCDEVFNPDPYEQSGDDMVRVAGLSFRCDPAAERGKRIQSVEVGGRALADGRRYKVVSWGVRSPAPMSKEPVWELVAKYLRRVKTVPPVKVARPQIVGAQGNFGIY